MAMLHHICSAAVLLLVLPSTEAHRNNAQSIVSNEDVESIYDKTSGTTCEDKFARGLTCQVFVTFFGKSAFILHMDWNTTVSNLKTQLEKWIHDKSNGHQADSNLENKYDLFHRVNGKMKKLVGDDKTLLSLGVTNPETEISAYKGVKGGIAYGHEVSIPGQTSFLWPDRDFIVQIYYRNPERRERSICTGYIEGKHVLTAAHCFDDKLDAIKYITVITGDGAEHKLKSKVKIIKGYTSGNKRLYANYPDMAVATIDGAGYTPRVKAKLRKEPITGPILAYLAGFGKTEDEDGKQLRNRHLVEGEFMVGDDKCSVHTYNGKVSPTVGCAHSGESATSSCIGDSGGPWFLKENDGSYSVFGVNMGADDCRGWANPRATADYTKLSETKSFWQGFFETKSLWQGIQGIFSNFG